MISFTQVPYSDVVTLLEMYNQPVPTNQNESYLLAQNLLKNPNVTQVPSSIADYIIATSLVDQNVPVISTSEILTSSYDSPQLIQLSK